MHNEQFFVRWNDFQSNVAKAFPLLQHESDFYDVTLVSDDHRKISAHKYFKRRTNLTMAEANKIFALLFRILQCEEVSTGDMSKLSGKLTYYAPIYGGKWERGFLYHSFSPNDPNDKMIKTTLNIKSQAAWWVRCLGAGLMHTPIPLTWAQVSAAPVMLYADAAGPGHGGAGAIAFEEVVTASLSPGLNIWTSPWWHHQERR